MSRPTSCRQLVESVALEADSGVARSRSTVVTLSEVVDAAPDLLKLTREQQRRQPLWTPSDPQACTLWRAIQPEEVPSSDNPIRDITIRLQDGETRCAVRLESPTFCEGEVYGILRIPHTDDLAAWRAERQ